MPASPAADALRDTLVALSRAALAVNPDFAGPIQEQICAVVDDLKATGMSAEHVVIAIKAIARDAGLGPGGGKLLDTMITWCIEHYYSA